MEMNEIKRRMLERADKRKQARKLIKEVLGSLVVLES